MVGGREKNGIRKVKEQPGMGGYWEEYSELIMQADGSLRLEHRCVFCSIYAILAYVA